MVIIKTKYLPATNRSGSKIKASANGFTASIPYPHALSYEYCHFEAVKELVKKHSLDWDISKMGFGSDDNGYYFTLNNSVMEA
jgi:hypothetical protein